jgi:hypothetical protein
MTSDKVLTDKEQEDHLNNSWKGKIVTFTYPEKPYERKGDLLERLVVKDTSEPEKPEVNYWNILDIIKMHHDPNNPNNIWLRITYYRYLKSKVIKTKKGKVTKRRWIFGGQTSISDPISAFEELFVKAIQKDETGKWVRPLFKNISERCSKELK